MGQGGDADAVPDEFSLIARLFEPLCGPEGLYLRDDAAMYTPQPGHDLVLSKDAIAEGRHYLLDDPAGSVAKKLLRVSLSDLAAKGATPRGYLLSCAWSAETSFDWMQAFADSLKNDQAKFGLTLWGGDTIRVSGPSVFSLTAIGDVPSGQMITRSGAAAGDDLWVTGTIGDAALGLQVALGDAVGGTQEDRDNLISCYRVPQPPVAFGRKLCGVASAALDVSDGLLGDLAHMCEQSDVGAVIEKQSIPLSAAVERHLTVDKEEWRLVFGGGDDYQILFAAPGDHQQQILELARETNVLVTRIGGLTSDKGIAVVDETGQAIDAAHAGFTHF